MISDVSVLPIVQLVADPRNCVGIYIKKKLFLEVDSLNKRCILTLNNFQLGKTIRG
jgi:hypothetical protein